MFKINLNWFRARKHVEDTGRAAIARAAEFMADRARTYCPVDTGALRSSIIVQASLGGNRVNVLATEHYATYVEFGSLHGSTWIPPQPFMRNALSDTAREFPAIAKGAGVSAAGGSLGSTFIAGA